MGMRKGRAAAAANDDDNDNETLMITEGKLGHWSSRGRKLRHDELSVKEKKTIHSEKMRQRSTWSCATGYIIQGLCSTLEN